MGENTLGAGESGTGAAGALASSARAQGGLAALRSGAFSGGFSDSADTYWRRRFTVLMIGLALFAVAAWGLSEALRVTPGAVPSGSRSGHSGHKPAPGNAGTGGGSGSHGSRHGGQAHGVPGGTDKHSGRRSSRSHARGRPTVSPSPVPSPSAPGGKFQGFRPAFCARQSIVLSLSATQSSFGARQIPTFSLSVVSTQQNACSFNLGSGHLALVIKEGATRIWSSADCATGATSLVTALNRGVPTVVAVSWGKNTSAPGCSSPRRPVPGGVYTGYAVDGSVVSAPVTFRLG
ncbi:MAG TPA: hypothetical protein VLX31_06735 [Streptosporangiaceae bacterium]|nr:hypothetical protein [Streptosporangiaceae bacterium]